MAAADPTTATSSSTSSSASSSSGTSPMQVGEDGSDEKAKLAAEPFEGYRLGQKWILEEANTVFDVELRKFLNHSDKSENLEKLTAQVEQLKNRRCFIVSPCEEKVQQDLFALAHSPEVKHIVKYCQDSVELVLTQSHERIQKLLLNHKRRLQLVKKPTQKSTTQIAEQQRQEISSTSAHSIKERDDSISTAGSGWSNASAIASCFGEWDEHLRRCSSKIEEGWKFIFGSVQQLRIDLEKLDVWSSTNQATQQIGDRFGQVLSDCTALRLEEEDSDLSIFLLKDYRPHNESYTALTNELAAAPVKPKAALPEQNPFTAKLRAKDTLQFHTGSDAVSKPRQAIRPHTAMEVKDMLQALFLGSRGGSKLTWSQLLDLVEARAVSEQVVCSELPTKLDAFRELLQEHLYSTYFPQHFGRKLLLGSDEKIAEHNLEKAAEKEKAKKDAGDSPWRSKDGKKRRGGSSSSPEESKTSGTTTTSEEEKKKQEEEAKKKAAAALQIPAPQEIQFTWFKFRTMGEQAVEFKSEADRVHRSHESALISEKAFDLMKSFMMAAYIVQNAPCFGLTISQNTASVSQLAAEEKRKKSFYSMRTAVLRMKNDRVKAAKEKDSPEATEKALRQQIADLEKEKVGLLQKDYTQLSSLLGKGGKPDKDKWPPLSGKGKGGSQGKGGGGGKGGQQENSWNSWKGGGKKSGAKGGARGRGGKKGKK